MINYKDLFLNLLSKYDCIDNNENINGNMVLALEYITKIVKLRFANELKQYGGDETKAYDEFIAKKILTILNYYVEELYLIDKELEHDYSGLPETVIGIRKEMRDIIMNLRYVLNESKRSLNNGND